MAYPYYPAYQPAPYSVPQFAPQGGVTMPQQPQTPQSANMGPQTAMTPPTIHAEIIQVESEEAVDTHPHAAGTSQMYMTRAEDKIIIKTQYANGYDKIIYDKRPPAPPAPAFVPEDYVRRDEIGKLVAAAVAALEREDAI